MVVFPAPDKPEIIPSGFTYFINVVKQNRPPTRAPVQFNARESGLSHCVGGVGGVIQYSICGKTKGAEMYF